MLVLPLVDLFILLGSGSFAIGALLKAIAMTTRYQPTVLGLTSVDFALVTAVCFAFALTLAARTWLKLNEPRLLALQSRLRAEEAHRRVREFELANGSSNGHSAQPHEASLAAARHFESR
jgi:hypothetical protein